MTYKLRLVDEKNSNSFDIIVLVGENGKPDSYIPSDPANTDYQEYLAWLAEGNEPLPADEL